MSWLSDRLEELKAQVNPFDGGKTATTVRRARKSEPVKTQKQKDDQPGFQLTNNSLTRGASRAFDQVNPFDRGRSWQTRDISNEQQQQVDLGKYYRDNVQQAPQQSFGNKIRDILDTNTEADIWRRQQQNFVDQKLYGGQAQQEEKITNAANLFDNTIGAVPRVLNTAGRYLGTIPIQVGLQFATNENNAARVGLEEAEASGNPEAIAEARQRLINAGDRLDDYMRQAEGINSQMNRYSGGVAGAGTMISGDQLRAGDLKNIATTGLADTAQAGLDVASLGVGGVAGSKLVGGGAKQITTNLVKQAPRLTANAGLNYGAGVAGAYSEAGYQGADLSLSDANKAGLLSAGVGTVADVVPGMLYQGGKNVTTKLANTAPAEAAMRRTNINYNELLNTRKNVQKAFDVETNPTRRRQINRYLTALDQEIAKNRGVIPRAQGFIAGENAADFQKALELGRTFEGVDGKPRFEVDDSGAKIKNPNGKTLGEVLDHPKLYEQYPELANTKVLFDVVGNDKGYVADGVMHLNPKKPSIETVLHENQHLIQDMEGFAQGGSPSQFKSKSIPKSLKDTDFKRYVRKNSIGAKLREAGYDFQKSPLDNLNLNDPRVRKAAQEVAPDLLAQYDELNLQLSKYQTADQQYRNLAGEAEARAVASRMNMSDGERYVTPKTKAGDYVGSHQAPTRGDGDYHAPASDVTGGAGMFPDDIYTDPQAYRYYGHGGDAQGVAMDKKSIELIRALKDKPDAEVTMYRAVPEGRTNDINAGDWVTLNKDYARLHNNSQFDGKGVILEKKVKADELYTDGNSIHEFGYDPRPKPQSTFYDSLDVPKEDLIIRDGGGKAMSVENNQARLEQIADEIDKLQTQTQKFAESVSDPSKVGAKQIAEYQKNQTRIDELRAERRSILGKEGDKARISSGDRVGKAMSVEPNKSIPNEPNIPSKQETANLIKTIDEQAPKEFKKEVRAAKQLVESPDIKNKATKKKLYDYTNQYLGEKQAKKIDRQITTSKLKKAFNLTDEEKINALMAIDGSAKPMNSKVSQYAATFKQLTDKAYKEYTDAGINMGYVDEYLPRIYRDPVTGEAITSNQYNLLTTGSARQKSRTSQMLKVDDLISKDPAELLDKYYRSLDSAASGRKYLNQLEKENIVRWSSGGDVRGMKPIIAEGLQPAQGGMYYAPKDIADKLNTMFGDGTPTDMLGKGLSVSAKVNNGVQTLVLSGGVPGTPINSFGIMQGIKETLAGNPINGGKGFFAGMSKDYMKKLYTQKKDMVELMALNGVDPRVDYSKSFRGMFDKVKDANGTGSSIASAWHALVDDPTFGRMMPTLELLHFESVYKKQVKKGIPTPEAAKIAADSVKNFYGIADSAKMAFRSQTTKDATGALLFAPRFREAMVNFWGKNIKALNPKNLGKAEYRANQKFMAGAALLWAGMEGTNYALNGVWMHDNPDGKKDKLLIPADKLPFDTKGKDIGVPFLSSIATVPRNVVGGLADVATGNFSEAGKKVKSFASMPLQTVGDVLTNQDYFGGRIYDPETSAGEKFGSVGSYVFRDNMQPWVAEGLNTLGKNLPESWQKSLGVRDQSTAETVSRATEAPFRFYNPEYYKGSKEGSAQALGSKYGKTGAEIAITDKTEKNDKGNYTSRDKYDALIHAWEKTDGVRKNNPKYDTKELTQAINDVKGEARKTFEESGLPVDKLNISGDFIRDYARYVKSIEGANQIDKEKKTKEYLRDTYKNTLDDASRSFWSLQSNNDMRNALDNGLISKEQMDNIIELDNMLVAEGLYSEATIGKTIRSEYGYGMPESGSGSSKYARKSSKSSGGKKKSNYRYSMFYGGGSAPISTTKSLRSLLEEATLS